MSIKQIQSEKEYCNVTNNILPTETESLIVVDYYTDSCAPCLAIAPKIHKLAADTHGDVKFYKINVDDFQNFKDLEHITNVPTFGFYKNGQLIDTVIGANFELVKSKIAYHKLKMNPRGY